MKYLSLLPALLLMYGNCSFAIEDVNNTQQQKRMTMQEKAKRVKERMEEQKKKMEERHRRGRIRTTQQEPMFDNSVTITVDGETQKI